MNGTQTTETPSVRGRKDKGVEAVVKPELLDAKLKELVNLHRKKTEAAEAYNDAVKRTAEKSGLLAEIVNKVVTASANDKYDEAKQKAQQLALAFDECSG